MIDTPSFQKRLSALEKEIRLCRVCAPFLPLGARPIIHIAASARLLIIGQAPGTKAHHNNKSFSDPSGDRLRKWLDLSTTDFYNQHKIAIFPMGLCYPGKAPKGGDLPPRTECAPLWRQRVTNLLPNIKLTLLVGSYAQNYFLERGTVTERVFHFRTHLEKGFFPLPHPSWRTTAWEKQNPWFQGLVIPHLRDLTNRVLRD
ncbi:uracil-DNA glycosylase family protein [Swingsia samuiensis]|uniref:Uracil-DNA glycosylase family protein n=1 Tax=Swingsia samuiensis TaxID=1293412 RepID=A0A4Y6UJ16_9PROT|nr:uracil-DNA glycosylase family protein [Swingsia samuiensis]QDH17593.1 uracil-DNA glycosylase family protein [Swingsia samuiensis]